MTSTTTAATAFADGHAAPVAESIESATARAVKLMRPEAATSFEPNMGKAKSCDTYGKSSFGQGVLLAHRLVEPSRILTNMRHQLRGRA